MGNVPGRPTPAPTITSPTTTPGTNFLIPNDNSIVEPNSFHSASDGALGRLLIRANTENNDDKEAAGTATDHISGLTIFEILYFY